MKRNHETKGEAMRRAFSTLFVSALTLAFAGTTSAEPLPGGTLDTAQIEKYARPLTVPEAMPETPQQNASLDYYEIAVRQFQQEVDYHNLHFA